MNLDKGNQHACPHKNSHTDLHGDTIITVSNVNTTQMSVRWLYKKYGINSNETSFGYKKQTTNTCYDLDEP